MKHKTHMIVLSTEAAIIKPGGTELTPVAKIAVYFDTRELVEASVQELLHELAVKLASLAAESNYVATHKDDLQ